MKKVLILGAGMVAKPIIQYLLNKNYYVTVASNTPERAIEMINNNPNGKSVEWQAGDNEGLSKLIADNDITVSLLPYAFHVMVAQHCINHKKNMVTTSYAKPEMLELNKKAKDAGIVIINEAGLDPGIDHMSAMRIIDHIHNKGGQVEEFYSLCGALPAPEAANNPFKYKFSWSPKGVVMAGNNDAKFLKHEKVVDIPTENLFRNPFFLEFPKVGKFEVYPNRDSISYKDIYGIPEAKTIFRGTFRYIGWCEIIDSFKKLKLISYDKYNFKNKTYADMLAILINADNSADIKQKVAKFLNKGIDSLPIIALDWLGLFDNKLINRDEDSTFEITSDLMIEKMQLGLNERDMVIMQHVFLAKYKDGNKEVIRSRMLDFGTLATDTSIARTVALPAAIAVELILNNSIHVKGVYRPVIPEIYNPILNHLEKLNIKMVEEYNLPLSEMIN